MNIRKNLTVFLPAAAIAICAAITPVTPICASEAAQQVEEAQLVDASIVTEVLYWGETVTALRLEYSEEIDCSSVMYSASNPSVIPYQLLTDRDIVSIYVNNSGEKDEHEVYGKYVFINLGIENEDPMSYYDQVTFNTAALTREKINTFYINAVDLTTRSGKVIKGGMIQAKNEICLGVDDFTTFTYTDETGNMLNYHLYIPEGYEKASADLADLPLVVHFPSNDYLYEDWNGLYRGALFTHPDCTIWASDEVQEETPCFVVTMGSPVEKADWKLDYEESWLQQSYMTVVNDLLETYNIDSSRVYGICLAAGALDMWNATIANPDLFAAEIVTSCDLTVFEESQRQEKMAAVLDAAPTWILNGYYDQSGNVFLGENDGIDKALRMMDQLEPLNEAGYNVFIGYAEDGSLLWDGTLRGEAAEQMAEDFLALARANGSESYLTMYMPGTIEYAMHWTWNAAYANAAVRGWLFDHVND